MKKSNLKNLEIKPINAKMVKGGRKLRPDGTTSTTWSWGNP